MSVFYTTVRLAINQGELLGVNHFPKSTKSTLLGIPLPPSKSIHQAFSQWSTSDEDQNLGG